jgi:hypothetical protein
LFSITKKKEKTATSKTSNKENNQTSISKKEQPTTSMTETKD